jgi:hypothetical protein
MLVVPAAEAQSLVPPPLAPPEAVNGAGDAASSPPPREVGKATLLQFRAAPDGGVASGSPATLALPAFGDGVPSVFAAATTPPPPSSVEPGSLKPDTARGMGPTVAVTGELISPTGAVSAAAPANSNVDEEWEDDDEEDDDEEDEQGEEEGDDEDDEEDDESHEAAPLVPTPTVRDDALPVRVQEREDRSATTIPPSGAFEQQERELARERARAMPTLSKDAEVDVVAGLPRGGRRTRAIAVVAGLTLLVTVIVVIQSSRARDARLAADMNRTRLTPTAKTGDSVVIPPPSVVASAEAPAPSATEITPDANAALAPIVAAATTTTAATATTVATVASAPPSATAPVEASPPVNGSLVKQAQRALEHNQVGNALALAQQATQQSPGNADAWWMLGACYDAAGQRGQAKSAYQRCANLSGPVSTECKALLGR